MNIANAFVSMTTPDITSKVPETTNNSSTKDSFATMLADKKATETIKEKPQAETTEQPKDNTETEEPVEAMVNNATTVDVMWLAQTSVADTAVNLQIPVDIAKMNTVIQVTTEDGEVQLTDMSAMADTEVTDVVSLLQNTATTDEQTSQQPQADTDADMLLTVEVEGNSEAKPLFDNTDNMPVKVGDPVLDAEKPDFTQNLSKTITDAQMAGQQKVSISLMPEHLGNITVELSTNTEGVLHVVIHTENEYAGRLISDNATALGQALQNNSEEVRIEVQYSEQTEQPNQEANPDAKKQNNNSRNQRNNENQNPQDFIEKLRLGIASVG